MSSRAVRETVRNWITTYNVVPYYDTVNLEQNPADETWCTVDWGFSFYERMTYCDDILEDGTFQVIFFGAVGVGDDGLLLAAEMDMETLLQQIDPTGKVVLISYNAAEEYRDDNFYGVSFMVDYQYQR